MTHIKSVLQAKKWQRVQSPPMPYKLLCNPDCQTCGGVGYIRYDVEIGDPRFGKTFPCPDLPPESSIYQGHGLTPDEIRLLTWSSMQIRENINVAIKELKETLDRGHGMGYLFGGAGLAKTKLLQILCAEWARSGRGIFHFTTQKDIMDDLRTAYDDDEPNRAIKDKQEKYVSYPLLAIDELTAERSTEFKVEQFFHIVNKRHEAGIERGENFITVMAGNISPKQLDFRVMDRLSDGRNFIVRLTGESYRPNMKYK